MFIQTYNIYIVLINCTHNSNNKTIQRKNWTLKSLMICEGDTDKINMVSPGVNHLNGQKIQKKEKEKIVKKSLWELKCYTRQIFT